MKNRQRNRDVPADMVSGLTHPTNKCGTLEIIRWVSSKTVRVRFITTGYERYAEAGDIRKGVVKDPYHPQIVGVGYFGVGPYSRKEHTTCYQCWFSMLHRCYDPATKEKQPTYVGCSVVDEWHNFQAFAEWYLNHYVEGYHLDKDIKVLGNKIYGPDFCTFVSLTENNIKAQARYWELLTPEGEYLKVYNLQQFCRDNNLNQSLMSMVMSGKRNHHKGYKRYE